ncbi:helix-turn-helix domain-containing protein [Parahaliea mediterranea]|uniref:Helix-turn-helix domain-containing protein n=1 Tax=Parahaliea mediterranea TaxID=651086 RepID=A0A939ILF0_9GAMM|nr:helix-turn-helix domain-containing protein [Parahaliea mediterranea]MBN7795903.1 helix-turn-helix domain-containing protein [Parahaliea mediterranea]
MNTVDSPLQAPLISLTEALVAALQSEDAETAFVEESGQFVDLLGDTLSLPYSAILNFDHMDLQGRRELLEETLADLGLGLDNLDWPAYPELAVQFQNRVWQYLYRRFLNTHQAVSSHVELLPAPEPDYPRPLFTPAGSWLMLFIESGECLVNGDTGGRVFGSDGPAVLVLPPESSVELCRGHAASRCSLFSNAFFPRETWLPLLQAGQDESGPRALNIGDRHIAADLKESQGRIIDIAHSQAHHALALHFNLLERMLLLCDELRPRGNGEQLDRRVVAARDYLLAHYREKTTVEQVAAAANAAPSTLNALFKNQIGENLMRWRDQLRMQRARELLQGTDKPIKVIATEVGYDDPMFFSRRFKQLTGWSPTQVRDSTTK